jgi:ring-1,2-phenylacetyl-CoA epoxidase subunit PaaC
MPAQYELTCANTKEGIDPAAFKDSWYQSVQAVLTESTLQAPPMGWSQSGGKDGMHTEHLGFILAELQFMQRAYPGNEW